MRSIIVSIVQKCICVDFLINTLIKSNSYSYLNFLPAMKEENLRNIKILCYLYEYLYKDVLVPEDITPIKLDKNCENNFNTLLKFYLEIICDLECLLKYTSSLLCHQFLKELVNSYFNFCSYINYIYWAKPNTNFSVEKSSPFDIFNKLDNNKNYRESEMEFIRYISIEAIDHFFNYSLLKNNILYENYEIFFENNLDNKFYQYFFKSPDRVFKIRIWDKSNSIFYLYQNIEDSIEVVPSMSKDDAKSFADSYLYKKIKDDFKDLLFDKDFLNIYSYMNVPESYKFKYNYKNSNGKINLNKGLYITMDAKYVYVQELSLF